MAAGILDGLFVKLGFDVDQGKLDKFNAGMKTAAGVTKNLALAVVGLATSFALLFITLSKQALAQTRFAKNIGTSRASIEAFDRASRELTGSSGTGQSLLEMFASMENQFKATGEVSEQFLRGLRLVGIDFRKFISLNPDEQILQLAEGFQTLSKEEQDAAQHLLGFNQEQRTLAATLTRAKFADSLPTEQEIQGMEEINKLAAQFNATLKDAVTTVGNDLVPILIPFLQQLQQNLPIIIDFVGTLTKGFFALGEAIGVALGFLKIEGFDRLAEIHGKLVAATTDLFDTLGSSDKFLEFAKNAGNTLVGGNGPVQFSAPGPQGQAPRQITQHNEVNVNVTGGGDPVATGNAAGSAIEGVLNNQARGLRTDDKI